MSNTVTNNNAYYRSIDKNDLIDISIDNNRNDDVKNDLIDISIDNNQNDDVKNESSYALIKNIDERIKKIEKKIANNQDVPDNCSTCCFKTFMYIVLILIVSTMFVLSVLIHYNVI